MKDDIGFGMDTGTVVKLSQYDTSPGKYVMAGLLAASLLHFHWARFPAPPGLVLQACEGLQSLVYKGAANCNN